MDKRVEMELLRERLVHIRRHEATPPPEMMQTLLELATELYPNQCHFELVKNLIESKLGSEQYEEAVRLLFEQMQRFPDSVDLQKYYKEFAVGLAYRAELSGLMDPGSYKFRILYELASKLGEVTLLAHGAMVEHFILNGEQEKAQSLRGLLEIVAPGMKVRKSQKEAV